MDTKTLILAAAGATLAIAVIFFLTMLASQRKAGRAGYAPPAPPPSKTPQEPEPKPSKAPKAPAERPAKRKRGKGDGAMLLPPLETTFPATPPPAPLETGEWAPAEEPEEPVVFDASLGEIAPGTVHADEPPIAVFVPPDTSSDSWQAARFEPEALHDIESRLAEPEIAEVGPVPIETGPPPAELAAQEPVAAAPDVPAWELAQLSTVTSSTPSELLIEPTVSPAAEQLVEPVQEPAPLPVPEPEPAPLPVPEPEPAPLPVPEPDLAPLPVPEPEPAPLPVPEPEPAYSPAFTPVPVEVVGEAVAAPVPEVPAESVATPEIAVGPVATPEIAVGPVATPEVPATPEIEPTPAAAAPVPEPAAPPLPGPGQPVVPLAPEPAIAPLRPAPGPTVAPAVEPSPEPEDTTAPGAPSTFPRAPLTEGFPEGLLIVPGGGFEPEPEVPAGESAAVEAASAAAAYFGLSLGAEEATPPAVVAEPEPQPEADTPTVEEATSSGQSTDDQIAAIMSSMTGASWQDTSAATVQTSAAEVPAAAPEPAFEPPHPAPVHEPAPAPEPPVVDAPAPSPDVAPPAPTDPAQAQVSAQPAAPEYRMVAPVELTFSASDQRVGIKPGTPTFLKYQRLAGVLTSDLKKATTGSGG